MTIDQISLTAYALNELSAEDRAEVEAHLANHPADRQLVTDIQATAAVLSSELALELESTPALELKPTPRRSRWATAAIGVAAATALAAGIGVYVHQMQRQTASYAVAGKVQQTSDQMHTTDATRVAPFPLQSAQAATINPDPLRPSRLANPLIEAGKDSDAGWRNNPFVKTQHDNIYTDLNGSNDVVPAPLRASSPNNVQGPSSPYGNLDSVLLPEHGEAQTASGSTANPLSPAKQSSTDPLVSKSISQPDRAGAALAGQPSALNFDVGKDSSLLPNETEIEPAAVKGRVFIIPDNYNAITATRSFGYSVSPASPNSGDTETYNVFNDNRFLNPRRAPLSTFAVDVDTASYSNIRRFIEQGEMPPRDAVRIQDLINYFPYSTQGPGPTDTDPVAVHVEVADCPWQPEHRLARIVLKAKTLIDQKRPASNLVFLLDVSGSMADENKLPLLKQAMKKLVNRLTPTDRVSIVTYAGNAQMTLASTACSDDSDGTAATGRQLILAAIEKLNADGETNGGDGIQLAYKTAVSGFIKDGVNRVILATDGDFNVGVVDPNQLDSLIDKEATTGVYLTVLGVGMGNVKDSTMEKLASHGKGNYAYLDSVEEADKVLGRQINSTLVTVAKDVKLQVEFNPATVSGYRLIGYEDRAMPNRDFNNDQKTAGEMGAGHSVVALYELVPPNDNAVATPLKYQPAAAPATNPLNSELMTVSVRYQPPAGGDSRKLEVPVIDKPQDTANASADFRFTAAVASFGMILRNSPYRGNATLDQVIEQATAARGEDPGGYRAGFIELVKRTKSICGK